MNTFHCGVCGQPVYFENTRCTHCGATLGFLPDRLCLSALVERADGLWELPGGAESTMPAFPRGAWFDSWFGPGHGAGPRTPALYRKCANYAQHNVCNWMVPADLDSQFCVACRLNHVIPNLARPENLQRWFRIERSKRRLVYSLLRLGLPVRTWMTDPEHGLGFQFLSKEDASPGEAILTGHDEGSITLNVDEADPVTRERVRLDMDEKYRTLLGHFRHEIGHYYWERLIRDGGRLDEFRAMFGDERRDYAQALQQHYQQGAWPGWQQNHVSAYASAHPWEDWAETWAHYLHIVDTLETSAHFGITASCRIPDGEIRQWNPDFDPYTIDSFAPIIDTWLPLTFALNSINRSMGQPDLYPFVLSPAVIAKLFYLHQLIRTHRSPDSLLAGTGG